MSLRDISSTIEQALAASALGRQQQPLVDQVTRTIRDALNAAGLVQDGPGPRADPPTPGQPPGTPPGAGAAPARHQAPAHSAPQEMLACRHANSKGHRDYRLFVPSSYNGGVMPLLVMLHGCQQNPDDFARGTRMNAVAEELGLLVAYPAQPARANGSNCWNWFEPSAQARDGEEPSLIAGIARQIGSEYKVDPARVFVAGLSAGAAMAVILGAAYPEVFKAVGVHSGLPLGAAHDVPSAFAAMQGRSGHASGRAGSGHTNQGRAQRRVPAVRTIVFHGDADTTVHQANGQAVVAQAVQGFQSETSSPLTELLERTTQGGRLATVTTHQDLAGRTVVESWAVAGAGHAWSGGDPSGSYTDALGPDASREMLRFFLAA